VKTGGDPGGGIDSGRGLVSVKGPGDPSGQELKGQEFKPNSELTFRDVCGRFLKPNLDGATSVVMRLNEFNAWFAYNDRTKTQD
jgi:hypothetical protein